MWSNGKKTFIVTFFLPLCVFSAHHLAARAAERQKHHRFGLYVTKSLSPVKCKHQSYIFFGHLTTFSIFMSRYSITIKGVGSSGKLTYTNPHEALQVLQAVCDFDNAEKKLGSSIKASDVVVPKGAAAADAIASVTQALTGKPVKRKGRKTAKGGKKPKAVVAATPVSDDGVAAAPAPTPDLESDEDEAEDEAEAEAEKAIPPLTAEMLARFAQWQQAQKKTK